MQALFLCILLALGPWMDSEHQEDGLIQSCNTVNESAIKRPPIDTKVIHYTNQAIVLVYHHLDEKESFVTISPSTFIQHLQVLKDASIPIRIICIKKRRVTREYPSPC